MQLGRFGPLQAALGLLLMLPLLSCSDSTEPPVCVVSADSLDFGNVLVGSTRDLTVTLGYTGGALNVTPSVEAPFSLPALDSTGVVTVPPGDSLALVVRYEPTAPGAASGVLTFDSGCASVALTGQGVTPVCRVVPSSWDFGSVDVGDTATVELTVVNESEAELESLPTISSIHFSLLESQLRIPPADSTTITVAFHPQDKRDQTASLVFPEGFCADVPLAGFGELLACDVSPSVVEFGLLEAEETATRSVTITNTGTQPVTGDAVLSGGPYMVLAGGGMFQIDPEAGRLGSRRRLNASGRRRPPQGGAETGARRLLYQ